MRARATTQWWLGRLARAFPRSGWPPRALGRDAQATFFCACLLAAVSTAISQTARPSADTLVGVYYFSGWWPELPNKYTINGKDWRPDWPDRRALLGEFVDQPTVDREIDAAAKYRVSFFQFLWYRPIQSDKETHVDRLNDGLRCFLASPNAPKMKFTVEFCNHPPFGIQDEKEWERQCVQWAQWMKHPSYLRVGGRAVFKIHGLTFFIRDCGGPENAATWIAALRRIAREQGAGEVLVSSGVMAEETPQIAWAAPFDFLTTYMDVPQLPQRDKPYGYEELSMQSAAALKLAPRGGKSYVPYVPAGWDPRPWHDPRPSFEMPTKEQWVDILSRTKRALDENQRLGIRLPDGARQKMLMIYAWNEFGEGGIVAPTQGRQYQMLEGIRDVFNK